MRLWHILRSRFRSVLFRGAREEDLAEELRLHLERQAEYWTAHGVPADEARMRARRQFGNVESVKEHSRDARGTQPWDAVVRDTRHAARRLLRDWRFSVPAVLLLAIGIGANTAIFSIVNATLFRPSPYAESERLVEIYQNTRDGGPGTTSYPAYLDVAAVPGVFTGVVAVTPPLAVKYRDGGGQNRVRSGAAEYTTPSFPAVLGIRPALGRWFTADEARQGAPLVAVIGHRAWVTGFGRDRGVIGRTMYVEGQPTTIVGVAPEGYRSTLDVGLVTDFWLPIASGLTSLIHVRGPEAEFLVKARLRDGVTVARAQAAMDLLGRRLAAEYPDEDPGTGISVYPTDEVRVHPQIDTFISALASVVLAVVGLVLAIACSNLATLLLVRAAARAKDVSIRLAVGATRWVVVRHLLAESVLLSVAGGAVGCVVAWWLSRSLRGIELPMAVDVSLDMRVLAFAVMVSAVTGVLVGLAPALQATRLDLLTVIRGDGQTAMSMRRRFTLRNALVVFQVTASVVMLAATGAIMQVAAAGSNQRLGYEPDGVAWIETDARYSGYTPERATAAYEDLRHRVAALPGVEAVALSQDPPMTNNTVAVVIEGAAVDGASAGRGAYVGSRKAAAGFFSVMRIPILAGRGIRADDRPGSARVAVITESMARRHFGGFGALGHRFRLEGAPDWIEVIGIVPDSATDVGDPEPAAFYYPVDQPIAPAGRRGGRAIIARTSGDASVLVREMQRELLAIDPSLPVLTARTMRQQVADQHAGPYAVAMSLGALGALGLLLAGVGLYAVIAFTVSRGAREIGIRMALGARRSDVVRDLGREVAAILGAGAGIGLGLAVLVILVLRASSNVSAGMVNIELPPPRVDPLQLAVITAFVLVVGIAAVLVPARRAAKMDPLAALRRE